MMKSFRFALTAVAATSSALAILAASATPLRAQWTNAHGGALGSAGTSFSIRGKSVVVSWKTLFADAKYKLLRASDSTSTGVEVMPLAAMTSFTDSTITTGRIYFYQVIGVVPGGKQVRSAPVRFSAVGMRVDVTLPVAPKKP